MFEEDCKLKLFTKFFLIGNLFYYYKDNNLIFLMNGQ